MDGIAPSASRGHGAIQERAAERPSSCATKQPLPPAEPGGTHLPRKPRRRSTCFGCCQTSQKHAGLSRQAAFDAQHHQPGTTMLASQLGASPFFPSPGAPLSDTIARERANHGGVHSHSGSPSTTISWRRPPSWTWAPQVHVPHRQIRSDTALPLPGRLGPQHSPGPNHGDPRTNFAHAARWWPKRRGDGHTRSCRFT